MNTIQLCGHLGQDPELKQVGDNLVASFSVADPQYEGANKEKTTGWYNCQIWGNRANTAMEYLYKGIAVTIFGELKQRHYTRKDGTDAISLDVRVTNFMAHPRDASEAQTATEHYAPQANAPQQRALPPAAPVAPVTQRSVQPLPSNAAPRQASTTRAPGQRQPATFTPRPQPVAAGRGRAVPQETYDDADLDDVPFD